MLITCYCVCRLETFFPKKTNPLLKKDSMKKDDEISDEELKDDLYVERIRIENLEFRLYITIIFILV